MAKSLTVPRRDRPVAAAPSQAPTPSGPADFDPASHARFGHRYSQLAPAPAEESADQREAEEDGGDAEASIMSEGVVPSHADVPVATGGGSPIPPPVQDKMERSFGHSFADVRIHSGGEARQVGALAYTRGSDIHFQPGRYDPASLGGQQLLGHELAHVVQQRSGRVSSPQQKPGGAAPINADAGLEAEADVQGAKAARGERAAVSGAGAGVQRKAEDAPIQRWPEWPTLSGTLSALGTVASGALSAVAHPINTAASVYDAVSHPIATATSAYNYMTGGGTPTADPLAAHPPVVNNPPVMKDPEPVVLPPVKTAEEIAKEKEIDRLTGRNTASRATATRTPNADVTKPDVWAETAADPAATYDYRSLKGTTDRELAEKQYAAEANNRVTAAGPTRGALGSVERSGELVKEWDSVAGASKLTRSADIHGADGTVLKQADPDKPGKIDKARQDLLKSQLIADGRASATDIAPGDRAKAVKDSPVEALIKAGKDETSLEVIAARAEKSHQDAVGVTGLGKRSTVSGIDETKHEAQTQHILEHMELGVNQNKLAAKMKAIGKTSAEIDDALMDKTDPLKPVAKDAAGLEAEIDTHNTGREAAIQSAYTLASNATVGNATAKKAAGNAAADPLRGNNVAPAHFVGRHGAQTTKEDQVMRLAGGIAPDHKPAPSGPDVTLAGQPSLGNVSVPTYATAGGDVASASSRFGSAPAQMFAMEEAFAQAWHQKKTAQTMNVAQDIKNTQEQNVAYPDYDLVTGAAMGSTTSKKEWNDTGLGTPSHYSYERGGRLAVDVGPSQITDSRGTQTFGSFSTNNDPSGLGQGFAINKPDLTVPQPTNPAIPNVKEGNPLLPATVAKRIGAMSQTDALTGAKVILDEDKGGFTPQTAYPLNVAQGGMTQGYRTPVKEVSEHRTPLVGPATTLSNFVGADVPVPSTLGGSGKSEEELLAESLANIQAKGKTSEWDGTKVVNKGF